MIYSNISGTTSNEFTIGPNGHGEIGSGNAANQNILRNGRFNPIGGMELGSELKVFDKANPILSEMAQRAPYNTGYRQSLFMYWSIDSNYRIEDMATDKWGTNQKVTFASHTRYGKQQGLNIDVKQWPRAIEGAEGKDQRYFRLSQFIFVDFASLAAQNKNVTFTVEYIGNSGAKYLCNNLAILVYTSRLDGTGNAIVTVPINMFFSGDNNFIYNPPDNKVEQYKNGYGIITKTFSFNWEDKNVYQINNTKTAFATGFYVSQNAPTERVDYIITLLNWKLEVGNHFTGFYDDIALQPHMFNVTSIYNKTNIGLNGCNLSSTNAQHAWDIVTPTSHRIENGVKITRFYLFFNYGELCECFFTDPKGYVLKIFGFKRGRTIGDPTGGFAQTYILGPSNTYGETTPYGTANMRFVAIRYTNMNSIKVVLETNDVLTYDNIVLQIPYYYTTLDENKGNLLIAQNNY